MPIVSKIKKFKKNEKRRGMKAARRYGGREKEKDRTEGERIPKE